MPVMVWDGKGFLGSNPAGQNTLGNWVFPPIARIVWFGRHSHAASS